MREGIAIARSQPLATAATALIVAAICAVIIAAVGQSAAAEAGVLATIDAAGTRTIVISDPSGRAVIRADSVEQASALDGVSWALGFSQVFDVRNVDLGIAAAPVPARQFTGSLPDAIAIFGRSARPGEALAGLGAIRTLALSQSVGSIADGQLQLPIVGRFEAAEPLAFLADSVLVAPTSGSPTANPPLRELYVVAARVEDVERLLGSLRAVIHAQIPSQVAINTSERLVELRAVIRSELAANSRRLMLLVLVVGLVIVTLTLVWNVSQRRRDYGRRRALGASRSTIALLVLTQTAVGAVLGVLLGSVVGLLSVWRLSGSIAPAAFVVGVGLLSVVTAMAAGVLPAVVAAFRDPVRILRVP